MHSRRDYSNGDETDESAVNIYSTRESLYTTENVLYGK